MRIALSHLCQDVELVLSGINSGGNLGVDAYISRCTIAAVREAAFHRIPGIAVSHYRKPKRPINWEVAAQWTADVIVKATSHFPASPEALECQFTPSRTGISGTGNGIL